MHLFQWLKTLRSTGFKALPNLQQLVFSEKLLGGPGSPPGLPLHLEHMPADTWLPLAPTSRLPGPDSGNPSFSFFFPLRNKIGLCHPLPWSVKLLNAVANG